MKNRAEPTVSGVEYVGASEAFPSPGLEAALTEAKMVVVCPSNPL